MLSVITTCLPVFHGTCSSQQRFLLAHHLPYLPLLQLAAKSSRCWLDLQHGPSAAASTLSMCSLRYQQTGD